MVYNCIEELPTTVGWIKKLNAEQAIEQVSALKLLPARLLEENRVILTNLIQKRATGMDASDSNEVNDPSVLNTGSLADALLSQSASNMQHTGAGEGEKQGQVVTEVHPRHCVPDMAAQTFAHSPVPAAPGELTKLIETLHLHTLETIKAMNSSPTRSARGDLMRTTTVLSDLTRMIKTVSGTDPEQLLEFLKSVQNIFSLRLVGDRDTILQLLVKTDGPLRVTWAEAITKGCDWPTLNSTILEEFFPARILRGLVNTRVYRLQRPEETLRDFVDDIKRTASVLLSDVTDEELVEIVMQGINPPTRSYLCMQAPPNTLSDLNRLARIAATNASTAAEFENLYQRNHQQTVNPRPIPYRPHGQYNNRAVRTYNYNNRGFSGYPNHNSSGNNLYNSRPNNGVQAVGRYAPPNYERTAPLRGGQPQRNVTNNTPFYRYNQQQRSGNNFRDNNQLN